MPMRRILPFIMLMMTASAANAGGLVTRHQSSLQHVVDPTRTITSRTANSFAVSGSGVTMDNDGGSLSAADQIVGGLGTLSTGSAAGAGDTDTGVAAVAPGSTAASLPYMACITAKRVSSATL